MRVVVATAAVIVCLYALAANVPLTGWISPYRWMSPFGQGARSKRSRADVDEIDLIRSKLSNWRQPIENGPPLPPAVLRLLRPLIREALGLGPLEEVDQEGVDDLLSPLTRSILTSDPLERVHWIRMRPPDPTTVVNTVNLVLDELQRISEVTDPHRPSFHPVRE